jgi:hypothetical protein
MIGTVVRLREPRGNSYPYDECEITAVYDLGERGQEVVLTPLSAFAPVLVIAADKLWPAGFESDHAATAERAAAKAEQVARVAAARETSAVPAPWEGEWSGPAEPKAVTHVPKPWGS